MQSKYQGRTTANGTIEAEYKSEVYDYKMTRDAQRQLRGDFKRATEDSDAIICQLMEDLAGATMKLEILVNFIGDLQKAGHLSEELYNQMLGFVHDGNLQETSSKTR